MARICCAVLLTLLVGCSQSYIGQGRSQLNRGEYDKAIENFYKEIQTNPASSDAWRNLGIAFYKKGDLIKAEDALLQAHNIRPDVETQLFIGLVNEKRGEVDKAISAYSHALSLGAGGATEETLRGRLDALLAERMKREISQALANEESINTSEIPENSIAVTDFDGSDLEPDIQPIAKGLAELTAIDLAKVSSLQVLERRKLDVLQQEIELGRSGRVDVSTAPRVGRLLGSRRVVTGKITPFGEEDIRLDGVLINTFDSSVSKATEQEGQLQKFFSIQKAFVFGVLESMGVQLTQAERDAIEEVPTESFLAFLAYSRGLEYKSRGLYQQAQTEFSNSLAQDATFQMAAGQLKTVSGAGLSSSGSLESFEASVLPTGGTPTTPRTSGGELGSFQQAIVTSSGFVPTGTGTGGTTPVTQPPVVGNTGHVVVRGSVDGN